MRDFSRYRKFASNGSEGPSRKGETKAVRFLRREKSNIVVGGDARLRHPVSDQELKEDCVASFAVSNGQVVSAIGSVAQATNAEPVDFIAELNILKKGAPNALLPPASPFDLTLSTSWVARKRILLEQLKLNLMKNPKQAVTDMQVQSVWKICFKAIYDLYRSLIRKAETNPTAADATTDKIKAQNACQLFLDESNTYFSRLIYSLSQFWLPNATEICRLVEPKLKIQNIVRIGNRKCDNFDDGAVRCILHQLLVCKGDILRYSKKFDQAEDCYRKSLEDMPD